MGKQFVGTAKALVNFNREGTVLDIGQVAQCTQYELDCGYFDKATLKIAKKMVESQDNKSMSSPQTKGVTGTKG